MRKTFAVAAVTLMVMACASAQTPTPTPKAFITLQPVTGDDQLDTLQKILTLANGSQVTASTTVVTAGATISAGKRHIEFILSSDFAGTINGAAVSGAVGVYNPGELQPGSTYAAMSYTVTAGSAILTTW